MFGLVQEAHARILGGINFYPSLLQGKNLCVHVCVACVCVFMWVSANGHGDMCVHTCEEDKQSIAQFLRQSFLVNLGAP